MDFHLFRCTHNIFGTQRTWQSATGIFEFKFIIDITKYISSGNPEDLIKNNDDDKIKIFVGSKRKPSDSASIKKYNKLSEFKAANDLFDTIGNILETKLN
jgi:hypothetical protein